MRWALLGLFAFLPLQWYAVPGLPLGPQRLHLLAIAAFTAFVLTRLRGRAFAPVLRVAGPVLIAGAVFVTVWAGTSLYHSLPVRGPLQEAIQLVSLVAVAALIAYGAAHPQSRIIEHARWAALTSTVVLLAALALSMRANGVDPLATFATTIAQGDPEILQKGLFKSAFVGYGLNDDFVAGNIRHEMFGAVLAAMCLSSAATRMRPFASSQGPALLAYRCSMLLGALMIVISLSRSDMLAGAGWVALAAVTSARRFGITARQLAALVAGLVALAAAAASGFASVILVRFTEDTTSYEARDTLLGDALAAIPDHLWTGGIDPAGASSHMFVVDSTLRAGLLGGLAALSIVAMVYALFLQLALRLPREPDWMLPVTAALLLPMVRFFTAGGGVIPPVQYVALGIVAGFLTHRIRLSRAGSWKGTGRTGIAGDPGGTGGATRADLVPAT